MRNYGRHLGNLLWFSIRTMTGFAVFPWQLGSSKHHSDTEGQHLLIESEKLKAWARNNSSALRLSVCKTSCAEELARPEVLAHQLPQQMLRSALSPKGVG